MFEDALGRGTRSDSNAFGTEEYCGLGAVDYAASGASELLTKLGMEIGAGCCAPAFSRFTAATPAR